MTLPVFVPVDHLESKSEILSTALFLDFPFVFYRGTLIHVLQTGVYNVEICVDL